MRIDFTFPATNQFCCLAGGAKATGQLAFRKTVPAMVTGTLPLVLFASTAFAFPAASQFFDPASAEKMLRLSRWNNVNIIRFTKYCSCLRAVKSEN